MKIKYFYRIFFVFFGLICYFEPSVVYSAQLSEEDLQEIQEIKAHNQQQAKNRVSLDKYYKKNPNSMTPQSEEYWDLAWHARLADYGDEESQYVIARAYDLGQEVDQNPRKAVAFYQKAGDQGHIDACMRLGEIYTENKYVKRDDEKALYWYTKAGKNGYAQAQLKVSEIYKNRGDYVSAVLWREAGLRQLFPKAENLEAHDPELSQLKRLAGIQKRMNARGVKKNVLHENCLKPFRSKKLYAKQTIITNRYQQSAEQKKLNRDGKMGQTDMGNMLGNQKYKGNK